MKGVENLSVRSEKGPTGLRNAFHDCEKVEKTFYFCDLFIFFKTVHLTQLKAMKSSKLTMVY